MATPCASRTPACSTHRRPARPSRAGLACAAILSGPQPPKQPAAAQHRPEVKAQASSDASSGSVPLPEPDRSQPGVPAVDTAWLNTLVDNTVKAPYIWYSRALATRPLTTKALTSLVGFVLGDLIAQHFSHPGVVDVLRAARLGAYGFLIDGPVGSAWYDVLERYVFPSEPSSTKAVLAKTALDQVVYATIMTGVYFAVIKTLEGHPEAIMATLQAKFVPTLAANYLIWPLAHLINFRFVPSEYRILYNNVVCVAWLTYLSLLTHTKINILSLLHLSH